MYQVDEYTVSLLHFDDGIKDEAGMLWSIKNEGITTDSRVVRMGSASAYFQAVGGIYTDVTNDVAFGTGDFTIDFWLYLIGGNYNPMYGKVITLLDSRSAPGAEPIAIFLYASDAVGFSVLNKFIITPSNAITKNQWVHIACVRKNGTGSIFVNGANMISGDLSNNITQFPLYIGGDGNPRNITGAMKGYLDEFRISNIARWTSDFTPQSEQVLLRITMSDSSEREYLVPDIEAADFIAWCNRDVDTSDSLYTFEKTYNIDNSQSRKESLVFDQIISFEVMVLGD